MVTRLVARGVPRHVLDLAIHLDRERFEVEVLAGIGLESEGSLWEEASANQVVTHRLDHLQRKVNPPRDMAALVGISHRIQCGRYDLIHTHISKAGILGRLAAKWARVPCVHTYHGNVGELETRTPVSRAYLACERWAARSSTALLAVSNDVRDHLLELGIGHREQYRIVPNGIDMSRFSAGHQGIPRSQVAYPTIGCVCSLTPEKGVDVLLRAVPRIAERFPDLKVCIVGDGPLRAELEDQARDLGVSERVRFTGVTSDVQSWLATFDVFVSCSRREGQGKALMEAMAMGIVAVATRVGGVPELIRDGVHGVLVDSEDSAGLADALNSLLGDADRRRVLGDEGRCIVEKGYSMERMVDEMAGVYEAVAPTLP